jgi:hypothetical protein
MAPGFLNTPYSVGYLTMPDLSRRAGRRFCASEYLFRGQEMAKTMALGPQSEI